MTIAAARSPFFGYEAIRVPLYLAWHGESSRLSLFADYLQFVESAGYLRLGVIPISLAQARK